MSTQLTMKRVNGVSKSLRNVAIGALGVLAVMFTASVANAKCGVDAYFSNGHYEASPRKFIRSAPFKSAQHAYDRACSKHQAVHDRAFKRRARRSGLTVVTKGVFACPTSQKWLYGVKCKQVRQWAMGKSARRSYSRTKPTIRRKASIKRYAGKRQRITSSRARARVSSRSNCNYGRKWLNNAFCTKVKRRASSRTWKRGSVKRSYRSSSRRNCPPRRAVYRSSTPSWKPFATHG